MPPRSSVKALGFLAALFAATLLLGPAARAEKQDARKHYDQATAAFGLGRYADAAAEYEAAFRLRPDPALLYNCAQSYRLAGNKPRAVELYRNYIRLYGDAPNADDARKHITDLETQLAAERTATTAPPMAPAPPVAIPAPALAAATPMPMPSSSRPALSLTPPPAPAPDSQVVLAAAPTPLPTESEEGPSLARRPWFWVAVGAVVVGGTVAVLLATRSEKDPAATLGTVVGN